MQGYYYYFVEGDTERRMLEILKTEFQCVRPGKIHVFNVLQERMTRTRILSLKKPCSVVLVFDTDTKSTGYLSDNIAFLKAQKGIREVLCIPQVANLEEELLRCCRLSRICELTGSRSETDFKRDFIRCNHLDARLRLYHFRFERFWSAQPKGLFEGISNDSGRIRL